MDVITGGLQSGCRTREFQVADITGQERYISGSRSDKRRIHDIFADTAESCDDKQRCSCAKRTGIRPGVKMKADGYRDHHKQNECNDIPCEAQTVCLVIVFLLDSGDPLYTVCINGNRGIVLFAHVNTSIPA